MFQDNIQRVLVRGLVKFVPAMLARAGANFTQPRTKILADLCTMRLHESNPRVPSAWRASSRNL